MKPVNPGLKVVFSGLDSVSVASDSIGAVVDRRVVGGIYNAKASYCSRCLHDACARLVPCFSAPTAASVSRSSFF